MGLFDFLFGNKKKQEQERLERERQERLQREKEERIAQEREARLAENRRKDAERTSMTPVEFKSNCHQRYENGSPVKDLQKCIRTIRVEKNTNGCRGYKLQPGDGYIVKIFNDDLGKPNMSDKPMRVVRKTETSVELRGFPIEAQSPFGWVEVDYRDYGFIVYYESGKVSKCVLHMYDRNIFIEYRHENNEPLKSADTSSTDLTECEQYAQLARDAAKNGNTSMAHQYGIKVFNSISNNPNQINKISNITDVALSLGKLMEGDYFRDNDLIKRAVCFAYYFLTKAIKECSSKDPYLYVYRFSIVWEYNKVFYHLFAHSEGTSYDASPFSIMGHASTAVYNHHMEGMQMADVLTEPRVRNLDPALGNIFMQSYSKYRSTPSEQIISLGNKYHDQIYHYLANKMSSKDFDF